MLGEDRDHIGRGLFSEDRKTGGACKGDFNHGGGDLGSIATTVGRALDEGPQTQERRILQGTANIDEN